MDHVLNLYQPNTNQQQQAQNSQSSSNLILLSQGSSNNAAPLEIMEVDPQSLSSINHSNNSSNNQQQTISSSSSTASSLNLQQQQRYGHPQHMHHRSRGSGYPTSLLGVPQNLLMAANNVSGNANSRTSSNSLLNNYASLPVDLGQISSATLLSNASVGSGLDQHHPSLHGYPSHHMTSSNTTSSNNGAFGPFSSIQDATTLQMQRSTNSVTRGNSNNNSGNNDTDETPMVGVCIQQSPVVIH